MTRTFKTELLWWRHANKHRQEAHLIFDKWQPIKTGDVITPSWNTIQIKVMGYTSDGENIYLCYGLLTGTNFFQKKLTTDYEILRIH